MGTSYTQPTNPDWWREPIERTELIWIVLSFAWCLFMFGWMISWHWIGNQNMRNEAYKTTPEAFASKVADQLAKYAVRKDDATGEDVVSPPPRQRRLPGWHAVAMAANSGAPERENLSFTYVVT